MRQSTWALAVAVGALTLTSTGPAAATGRAVEGAGSLYYLADGWSGGTSRVLSYGRPDDTTYVGDWDGDGVDSLGVRRGNELLLTDSLTGGPAGTTVVYGRAGDDVLIGDWDGDGTDTPAVRRGREYHLSNSLGGGRADVVVLFGRPTDRVLVGDWDGDGVDTLAVRRESTYHLRNSLTSGPAEVVVTFGRLGDEVHAGDWDGDGTDTLAVRRGSVFHLQGSPTSALGSSSVVYGRTTDEAFVGDWDGDGADGPGLRRPPAHPTWQAGRVTDVEGVVPYSGAYDSRNGKIHPDLLCLVPFMPAHYLRCDAVADLTALDAAYRARFGERLPVDTWDRSTYRTLAEQEATWVEIGPPVAARPGTSPHGWGLAVDMFEGAAYDFGSARYEWMLRNGPRFGWQNMPWHQADGSVPEYWHFDYVR